MVKAPFAAQAAHCLGKSPQGREHRKNLPVRSVRMIKVRPSRQAQARCDRKEGKQQTAHQRRLTQTKDLSAGKHHALL
jgi:hypothetical protein